MIRIAVLIALAFFAAVTAATVAEDPYALWQNGRPAEALPALQVRAEQSDAWQAWFDLGLCAAAADQRGPAVGWLLAAHTRAPWRAEPHAALSALGQPPPRGWLSWLGPLAWPGTSWCALVLAGLGGLACGLALTGRHRGRWLMLALGAVMLLAPGVVASLHDRAVPLAAVVRDGHLLDATGRSVRPLPAGTVVTLISDEVWQERRLVELGDSSRGYVPETDLLRR